MKKTGLAILFIILVTGIVIYMNRKETNTMGYQSITMADAKERFESEGSPLIVDVRTVEEYKEGHIPGAICIPNETIGEEEITQLPNKEQLIYVYCRSGSRSKQAAGKLVKLGYTNIVEIGGIIDWQGDIEK